MNVALQYFSLTSGHSGWAFDSLLSISHLLVVTVDGLLIACLVFLTY